MGVQRGCVSECGAITVQHLVLVAVIARPTEKLVGAIIAEHQPIATRPTRNEIVTVPTCEHGGETVQGMARTVLRAAA